MGGTLVGGMVVGGRLVGGSVVGIEVSVGVLITVGIAEDCVCEEVSEFSPLDRSEARVLVVAGAVVG